MTEYKDLLGVRYTPHGRSKDEGFDCYGLAIEVLARNGITLNDMLASPSDGKINLRRIDRPERMCVVEFEGRLKSHIAVYLGDGLIIHARKDLGVCIERLSGYAWRAGGYYNVH